MALHTPSTTIAKASDTHLRAVTIRVLLSSSISSDLYPCWLTSSGLRSNEQLKHDDTAIISCRPDIASKALLKATNFSHHVKIIQ